LVLLLIFKRTGNKLDTLTHIVLGGCIGEATAGKQLGRKAILLGAAAQSIPDIDFLAYFWLGKTDNLLAHRGITHSVLFVVLATLCLSLAARGFFSKRKVPHKQWWLLFGINLVAHIALDSLNAYGVGWFEPFNDRRYSFHVLYVADPFFSVFPFIAFVLLFIFRKPRFRKMAWQAGLTISVLYMGYAFYNKLSVESRLRTDLAQQGIASNNFFTTPTPLNSWLWFVVVKEGEGYYTGYRSVFDKEKTRFVYTPRNDFLVAQVQDKKDVVNLLKFSTGYYTLEKKSDTILFNVLRFGQVAGWYDADARFAFHYFLDKPGANSLLVQRGRFQNWNRTTFRSFIKRIKGE
jgi:inner membrane protein